MRDPAALFTVIFYCHLCMSPLPDFEVPVTVTPELHAKTALKDTETSRTVHHAFSCHFSRNPTNRSPTPPLHAPGYSRIDSRTDTFLGKGGGCKKSACLLTLASVCLHGKSAAWTDLFSGIPVFPLLIMHELDLSYNKCAVEKRSFV